MKRIIVCADGTWCKPDHLDRGRRKPTNVVKIARAVLPRSEDGIVQAVLYEDGVGTSWGMDKIAGGGFGLGLAKNVLHAYQFIVLNYEPGDEIFLFGFSRGAYTVRSLAGMLDTIGILPKNHAFYMPEAYALYRNKAGRSPLETFRQQHNVIAGPVKFIGVWDTVGALGIPVGLFKAFNKKYQFHKVELTSNVENAYQALAIDECRRPFEPALWELPEGSSQTMQQVWFAGTHSNVGGGYSKDGLANCALQWIFQCAKSHNLHCDEKFLAHYKPWYGGEYRDSMTLTYRLLIPSTRKLNRSNRTHEYLHRSAVDRYEHIPGYRPKELVRVLENKLLPIEG